MKRKRETGFHKDELLLQTTYLNLAFNRCFDLEHNIHIYNYAKDKDEECIHKINNIVSQAIDTEKYIGMEDIKLLCNSI